MKLLFISSRDVNKKSHGGFQCTNRNYLSFCKLLGIEKVEVINLSLEINDSPISKLKKWINYSLGFCPGLSKPTINKILNKAKEADFVFIDSSQFGILAYHLKKQNYHGKIVSFFHNVEYNINLEKFKKTPINFWRIPLIYFNEKKAIIYSDKIVTLNERDAKELQRVYKVKNLNISIIPISFFDAFKEPQDPIKKFTTTPPTILFIGNNWYPNIHGITWFVKNVLDSTDIKLQIAGIGMDALKSEFVHPKIEFLGFVPDLKPLMINADYMISPIFKGGGMKVKTCEALMYGKNIIGTKESFEGYEIDYKKVGAICETKEEFIYVLNTYAAIKREKLNQYSRECFVKNYSFNSTLNKFEDLIQKN